MLFLTHLVHRREEIVEGGGLELRVQGEGPCDQQARSWRVHLSVGEQLLDCSPRLLVPVEVM